MDRSTAHNILDSFLFEEINNNRVPLEDEYQITWIGTHFAVLELKTGNIETFEVKFDKSYLSEEDWQHEFEQQGWIDED